MLAAQQHVINYKMKNNLSFELLKQFPMIINNQHILQGCNSAARLLLSELTHTLMSVFSILYVQMCTVCQLSYHCIPLQPYLQRLNSGNMAQSFLVAQYSILKHCGVALAPGHFHCALTAGGNHGDPSIFCQTAELSPEGTGLQLSRHSKMTDSTFFNGLLHLVSVVLCLSFCDLDFCFTPGLLLC